MRGVTISSDHAVERLLKEHNGQPIMLMEEEECTITTVPSWGSVSLHVSGNDSELPTLRRATSSSSLDRSCRSNLRYLEKEFFETKRTLSTSLSHNHLDLLTVHHDDESSDKRRALIRITPSSSSAVKKRPRSIMKKADSAERFINEKGPWKRLPNPDMNTIQCQASEVSSPDDVDLYERTPPEEDRNVSFESVQVRVYAQTLGDNPAVSTGAPIQLDWHYQEEPAIDINAFEGAKRKPRKVRQLVLSRYHRHNILMHWWHHTEEEVQNAKRQAKQVRRNRQLSSILSGFRPLDEILCSASRKANRLISNNNKVQ